MINIAKDFSRAPAGRFISDGPNSGTRFRDQFLVPALRSGDGSITIELDGVRAYGSSFLDEAFGGLIRIGFATTDVMRRLIFRSSDPSLVAEIKGYLR
ncbi:STAS-like domain-containing protein [Sphingomonas sp. SORGH_AS_0438]|uniref:STAS-like domain-containing protein n=1 Tax=Sphingomonas sp. SORGH_AS_0438 TaxID=3041756 RepID=UPI00386EE128